MSCLYAGVLKEELMVCLCVMWDSFSDAMTTSVHCLTKSPITQSSSPYWWGFPEHTNTAIPEVVYAKFTFMFWVYACSWNRLIWCQKIINKQLRLKGRVRPKNEFCYRLYIFISFQKCMTNFSLWGITEDILRNVSLFFFFFFGPYNASQWAPKLFGYQLFSKYLLLCSAEERNA